MKDEDSQGRDRNFGKRIANLVRSIGQGPEKRITGEEQQKLKAAVGRLDQMLKAVADADQQALKDAAGRLDRLLGEIHTGKDIGNRLKRRKQEERTRRA